MRTIAGRVRSLAVGVTAVTLLLGLQVHGWRQAPAQGAKPAGQEPAPPPKPTGIILGAVVDAAGNKPIAGATVTINGSVQQVMLSIGDMIMPPPAATGGPAPAAPTAPRQVMTSASGAFMFRELGKGRYTMRVSSPGYLAGSYGQSKPGGASQSIELLQEDERRGDLVIRMWKSASLSGTIVDEANEPVIGYLVRVIRRVMVAGKPRLSPGTTATTDDRGAYRFSGLTPGDYLVAVMLTQTTMPVATSEAYFQQMMAGGSSLNSEIYRELSSSGAPSGMMSGYRVGDLTLESSMAGRVGIGGALIPPPGDDGKLVVYPNQFYPASRLASQATVITLASGQDRSGIEFQLKLAPAFRVSGIVMGPDGPQRNLGVKLFPVGADEFTSDNGIEAAATATDATGAFTFLGVTPGDYTLKCLRMPRPQASNSPSMTMVEVMGANGSFMSIGTSGPNTAPPPPLPTELTLWATTSVSVSDSDVAGLSVALRTGARISGRLVFEGTKEPPGPDQLQRASISINPVSGSTPIQILAAAKRVETDGRFSTVGYPPGRYTVSASVQSAPSAPGGPPVMTNWTLKSAAFGGHDVSDEGLDLGADDVAGIVITFTDRQTELTGTVRGDKGQPDTTASVIVLPADSQAWRQGVMNVRRLRNVRTTTTGGFTVTGLPPGDYLVAAVNEDAVAEWQDPKFLEKVAAVAVHVPVGDGEKKSQELATKTIR
jgi:uncharacterized protein (DUF2141 family)